MAENYFTYWSIHKTFTQVRLLGTFYNAVSYIVFVQMLELNVKMRLNVSKIEAVKLMSHDQQMDGHIRSVCVCGGGVCSSVSQINSWTRLSSYCLNMQRGFWWGWAQRRPGNLSGLFPPNKSSDFLLQSNSASWVSVEETIPEICTDAAVTSSPLLTPPIAHLLKAGQHPTHAQNHALPLPCSLNSTLC